MPGRNPTFKPPVNRGAYSVGMDHRFMCSGCNQPRPGFGSRGKGLAKRCAECLAKRASKEPPK